MKSSSTSLSTSYRRTYTLDFYHRQAMLSGCYDLRIGQKSFNECHILNISIESTSMHSEMCLKL